MAADKPMNVATPKNQAKTIFPPPPKFMSSHSWNCFTLASKLCENVPLVFVCGAGIGWTQR